MFKRIIIPLALTALLLSSCSEIITVTEIKPKKKKSSNIVKVDKDKYEDEIELSPYYDSIELNSGFECLQSDDEKRLYNGIVGHAADFTDGSEDDGVYVITTFTVEDCYLDSDQIAKVFFAVELDNPSLFWLANPYSYSVSDGDFELTLNSDFPPDELELARERLNSVVNSILSGLKPDMSELEREIYLHDYLVDNCVYSEEASDSDFNRYNLYGCLVEQSAVCEGYTEAFQYLLSLAGINSITVNGSLDDSDNVDHVWNAVELDGDYYYTDVTWDDSDELSRYEFFNITTEQLLHSHSIAPLFDDYSGGGFENEDMISFNLIIPNCTAVKYNYYRRFGARLSSLSGNNLAESLASAAENGDEYFYIFVDDKLNFTMTYDQLFSDELFLFKNYIRDANSILGYDALKTSVSVAKRGWLSVIIVVLNYN